MMKPSRAPWIVTLSVLSAFVVPGCVDATTVYVVPDPGLGSGGEAGSIGDDGSAGDGASDETTSSADDSAKSDGEWSNGNASEGGTGSAQNE